MDIRKATVADAGAISAVAVQTFALACPPGTPQEEIDNYTRDTLQPAHFEALLAGDGCDVWLLDSNGAVAGFTLITHRPERIGLPEADDMQELTRCYVLATQHGTGSAQRLMSATLAGIAGKLRLTVNDENAKAIRFYERNGFVAVGETSFQCGAELQRDIVMVRGAK